jgi:hypothetical protein
MDQISIEAYIFMALGWGFVISMVVYTMKKVLTGKIEYDEND